MPTRKATKMYKKKHTDFGWDEAIAEAERLARLAKASASRLRATVKQLKRLQAEGAPFPGSKSATP
jgi:hypothetical protein